MLMRKNTILTNVTISELNPKWVGVIHVEWHDRPVVVSGGVLPGMVCDIRIIRKTRSKIIGRLIAVHDSGPYANTEPRCNHTLQSEGPEHKVWCWGCKRQIIAYEDQLALKKKSVEQCIYSEGVATPVSDTLPSPTVRGYRNKMEYSFGNYITGRGAEKRIVSDRCMGFHKQGQFGKIVDIDYCYLVDEQFNEVMNHIKNLLRPYPTYDQRRHDGILRYCMIRRWRHTNQTMVALSLASEGDKIAEIQQLLMNDDRLREHVTTMMTIEHDGLGGVLADRDSVWTTLRGEGTIEETLHIGGKDFSFTLSPQSFFQTNTTGAELLYSTVAQVIQDSMDSGDQKDSGVKVLFDLYCGTGTIGQIIGSLVPSIEKVVGIDIVPEAIEDAKANADRLGVDFVTEYHADAVENIFPTLSVDEHSTIIVDPPRAGLHQWATDTLVAIKKAHPTMKMCYVSCNPVTLARDLALLQEAFRVDSVQPVDMFPHTHHVETVVSLS